MEIRSRRFNSRENYPISAKMRNNALLKQREEKLIDIEYEESIEY